MSRKTTPKHRSARGRRPGRSGSRGDPPAGSSPGERLRRWLLAAIIALLVARPLFPSESAAMEGDGLTVVMLWVVILVLWMLGAVGRWDSPIRWGWTDAAVLLLVGLHTLAGVVAAFRASPRPAVNMLWEWIAVGLAFFLARQLVVTPREVRAILVVMTALAVGLSGYGLYQYCYEMPQTRAEYAADPNGKIRDAGLPIEPGSPLRELLEARLQSTEPIATFALTNSLAGYLVPWFVVAAGIAVGSSVGRKRVLVCMIPMAACLLLTKSRSGYIAAALGLALVWLLCRERRRSFGWKLPALVAVVGTVIAAGAIAAAVMDHTILSEATKSLGYRVQYWRSSMQLIADRPLLGCGPGNFQYAYTQYKLPEASEEVADPHNFLLEVWATSGTPAMLALLAVLGCFAWAMWRQEVGVQGSGFRPQGSESSDRARPRLPDDGLGYICGGAVCGFVLAVPLGQMSAAPPSLAAVLLGFPLAAGSVVLLRGWIEGGRLAALLPAIGVVALVVNLLAAGGIGMPGVAGSLWLLLALGLNLADGPPSRPVRRGVALAGLLLAAALAITCYTSAYGPVLRRQGAMHAAQRDPARARQRLADAAVADPLDARPWLQLAAISLESWRRAPSPERFQHFETCAETALKLTPNSSAAWLTTGEWYYQAFQTSGQRAHINRAVEAYMRAVRMYPNSGQYRAKLALAHLAAGDHDAFRREAEIALHLDRLTPHADKKIRKEVRDQLIHR